MVSATSSWPLATSFKTVALMWIGSLIGWLPFVL
jgi:hypothetical protein